MKNLSVWFLSFSIILVAALSLFGGEPAEDSPDYSHIVAIKKEANTVLVETVQNDNFTEGMDLFVVRGDERVATIRIVSFIADSIAEAEIIAGVDGIQFGDRVLAPWNFKTDDPSDAEAEEKKSEAVPEENEKEEDATVVPSESAGGKTEIQLLRDKVSALEKRIEEIEKKLNIPSARQSAADSSKDNKPSSEFDQTVQKMIEDSEKTRVEKEKKKPSESESKPDAIPDKAEDGDAENPASVPLIEGKIYGRYGENSEKLGIHVNEGSPPVKEGYVFYVYREEGKRVILVAKVRITDVVDSENLVGGPIIMNKQKINEMTDKVSTRLPADHASQEE